jgi:hypothetical protein
MGESDAYYEDTAPISDGRSLASGRLLCQGCIQCRQELYQTLTNLKSAEEILRILHDEINMSRMVDTRDRDESSMPSGKDQISSKTYIKGFTLFTGHEGP